MNESERYTILFEGLNLEMDQKRLVEQLWSSIAMDVERQGLPLVGAEITKSDIVCGGQQSCLSNQSAECIKAICIRNPVICQSPLQYRKALIEIIRRIKEKLGNPCAAVVEEQINFFYFTRR